MDADQPKIGEIALIGWDSFAERVLEQLVAARMSVSIVLPDSRSEAYLRAAFGDTCSVMVVPDLRDFSLLSPVLTQARIVLVNLADDREKLLYVVNLRKRFPKIKIVAPVTNPNLNETFVSAAEVLPLSKEEVSAKLFASYLFERDVAEFLNDLLSPAQQDDDYDIQEHLIPAGHPYIGSRYGDLFIELKKSYNAVLIGLSRRDGAEYMLQKNPSDELKIIEGDYLILVVSGRAASALSREVFLGSAD